MYEYLNIVIWLCGYGLYFTLFINKRPVTVYKNFYLHQLCTHRSQVQTLANKCEFPPSHLWCRIRGFQYLNSVTVSGSCLNLTPAKLSKHQHRNNMLDILVTRWAMPTMITKEPLDPHQCHRKLRPNLQETTTTVRQHPHHQHATIAMAVHMTTASSTDSLTRNSRAFHRKSKPGPRRRLQRHLCPTATGTLVIAKTC